MSMSQMPPHMVQTLPPRTVQTVGSSYVPEAACTQAAQAVPPQPDNLMVPVHVQYRRIERPREVKKAFVYHDPAYGPGYRYHQPDIDTIDREFMHVVPDVKPPLARLAEEEFAERRYEARLRQWEAQYQEMKRPQPYDLYHPTHAPASVTVQPGNDGLLYYLS